MRYDYAEITLDDDDWHVLPAVTLRKARNLVLTEQSGTEQLDVAISTTSGATWGETYRTMPGIPYAVLGLLPSDFRLRVKRVSSNTVTVQAHLQYDAP